jgi:hypothetical protein
VSWLEAEILYHFYATRGEVQEIANGIDRMLSEGAAEQNPAGVGRPQPSDQQDDDEEDGDNPAKQRGPQIHFDGARRVITRQPRRRWAFSLRIRVIHKDFHWARQRDASRQLSKRYPERAR